MGNPIKAEVMKADDSPWFPPAMLQSIIREVLDKTPPEDDVAHGLLHLLTGSGLLHSTLSENRETGVLSVRYVLRTGVIEFNEEMFRRAERYRREKPGCCAFNSLKIY